MAVDDLFDGDPNGASLPNPIPALQMLLLVASVLVAAGPVCCTGVFGGLLSLWIWSRSGDAISRIEAGLHPTPLLKSARRVRGLAIGLMSTSLMSLFVQSILWGQGFYQTAFVALVQLFGFALNLPQS